MQVFLPYLWLHTRQIRPALLLFPFAATVEFSKICPVSMHLTGLLIPNFLFRMSLAWIWFSWLVHHSRLFTELSPLSPFLWFIIGLFSGLGMNVSAINWWTLLHGKDCPNGTTAYPSFLKTGFIIRPLSLASYGPLLLLGPRTIVLSRLLILPKVLAW